MLFSVQDDNGELLCLVLVYVDDFLMCFHKRYDISVLKEMFEWGEWTRVRNGIKFKGKELALVQQPNGEYCVKVTQTAFIKNSIVGKLTQERSQGAPALTSAEMTEFRSCSGCRQWLADEDRHRCGSLLRQQRHRDDDGGPEEPLQTHVIRQGDG